MINFYRKILFLSCIFFSIVSAADNYTDSLKKAIASHRSDTARVMSYVNLAYHYSYNGEGDSSIRYYKLAIQLSEKISDLKFKGLSYYNYGLMFQNAEKYSEALKNFYIAISVYQKTDRVKRLGDIYNSIGVTHYYSGHYDSAIVNYDRAVQFFDKAKDVLGTARCYNNIGIMYDVKGDRVKSIESYLKAIKIYEENKREDLNTGPYQNIALIYLVNKQHAEALRNLEIVKKLAIKYKQDEVLSQTLNTIGSCLDETGKTTEAFLVFKDALVLAEKVRNTGLQATILTNLGSSCLIQNKYEEAEKMLLKSVELKKQLNNPVSMGISEIFLAQAYCNLKKYTQSVALYNEGLKKMKAADYKEYEKIGLKGLAVAYERMSKFREAYYNLNDFVIVYDSLASEANRKIVNELQTKYETDKKESEIKLLSKNQELQEVEIKRERTVIKFAVGVGILVFALLILVFFSWRNKRKANLILADKNKEIQSQRDEIHMQKEVVEEKNKEIVDSINYAKRLQEAILPPLDFIKEFFPESFVFYRPKAIVAGDFYFMEKVGDVIIISAADCTGHGVPGALVSVVCSNALSRCVKEFNLTEPGKILDRTRQLVLETFEKSSDDVKDGMDISLAAINTKTLELQWAGANNPLWLLQGGQMKDITATKQPIGKTENPQPFKTHTLQLNKGDIFYLFTDGYADQFGGDKGKKFKYKQLSELIINISPLPLSEQKNKLEEALVKWQGRLEQVDDICVIGIKA